MIHGTPEAHLKKSGTCISHPSLSTVKNNPFDTTDLNDLINPLFLLQQTILSYHSAIFEKERVSFSCYFATAANGGAATSATIGTGM